MDWKTHCHITMKNDTSHKSKLLINANCTLGEGPVWDWQRQWLFWVDIEGKKLRRHNLPANKNTEWSFDEMLGAAVPMNNGQLLLALESSVSMMQR